MTNKVELTKQMTGKVAEVMEAQEAVFSFLDEIEETVAEGAEAVEQMAQVVQAKKEAMTTSTEFGEVKLAQTEINSLEEDMELLKQINDNKARAMKATLEDKAEAFFVAHKGAVFFFGIVDTHFVANTSLATIAEDEQTLTGFGDDLANSFSSVRMMLLDENIVAQENQNRLYRGIHLGQAGKVTELRAYHSLVRGYARELKAKGTL
ncbi:hypothetical protein JOC77_000551 [Peribacillus deserti]|uniref:Uncharacterized protein n=1 Tax=Peribacillus deserti TaxID=673318 RepID=A0ABS2QDA7_9BACI|nr:hypothetical protein [Peribacillus deserti]MBM7691146.1 hypothetical protein [Peribacillus deserti]